MLDNSLVFTRSLFSCREKTRLVPKVDLNSSFEELREDFYEGQNIPDLPPPSQWSDELEGSDKIIFDMLTAKLQQPDTLNNKFVYEKTVLDDMWRKWSEVGTF